LPCTGRARIGKSARIFSRSSGVVNSATAIAGV
jgi:hypothetical protein